MAATPVYELQINSVPYYLVDMDQVRNAIAAAIVGGGTYSFSWRKVVVKYTVTIGSSTTPLGTYDTEAEAVQAAKGPIANTQLDTGTYQVRIDKVVSAYNDSTGTS